MKEPSNYTSKNGDTAIKMSKKNENRNGENQSTLFVKKTFHLLS